MAKERKMQMTGRKISFAQAEDADIFFWAEKTISERLEEADRLRKIIWTLRLGTYPKKMTKVGKIVRKNEIEE
jgi:glycyl-tRNA synthetase beta subunit